MVMKHGFPISPMNPRKNLWNRFFHTTSLIKVEVQDYGKCFLGQALCFASLYAKINDNQLRQLLRSSKEAPKSNSKQSMQHAVKKNFSPRQQCKASHF